MTPLFRLSRASVAQQGRGLHTSYSTQTMCCGGRLSLGRTGGCFLISKPLLILAKKLQRKVQTSVTLRQLSIAIGLGGQSFKLWTRTVLYVTRRMAAVRPVPLMTMLQKRASHLARLLALLALMGFSVTLSLHSFRKHHHLRSVPPAPMAST
jgi:hypothetical protein